MSTQDTKEEEDEKEVQNSQENLEGEENDKNDDKNNEAYFLILIPSEEKIDFQGLSCTKKNMIDPSIIFRNRVEKDDKTYLEEIVFKFKKKKKKKEITDEENESIKSTKYAIAYYEEEHIYNITFASKNEYFIYQPKLEIGNKFLPGIPPEPIPQNIVPPYIKLNIFIKALQEKNEINQKEKKLYKDTIDLYEQKKQFSLLITLFLKIYGKNKELCKQLIEIFYRINNEENNDKIDDLKNHLKSFKDIFSNARYILDENNYNPIHFYGILFCYLHFYDDNNFPKIIEEFSEGNTKTLYEILIHYYSHFINPLRQSRKFFEGFIGYALKENKGLKIFERIMNYIEDIETYLFVINSNKKEIFEKYEELRKKPFEIGAGLKLFKHKEDKANNDNSNNESEISDEDDEKGIEFANNIVNECHIIIKLIEKIITFSEEKKTLLIYIRSTFWINLLDQYKFPDWENISNCHKLRELYKKYTNLVNKLYEENYIKIDDIKNDINTFYKRDQFAFQLNNLIKEFLDKNQQRLTNAEKLGCVREFNPYFSIKDEKDINKFKNNRETYIFDYVNFSKITPAFIEAFHIFNFEKMFEENISEYINKITGKIKDIQTFGNIIKLIDEKRMKEENQKEYYRMLKKKYGSVIKGKIKLIKDDKEINNVIKIIAEFVSKIFLFYGNNNFLKEEIDSLEDNIKSLIYLELITSYNQEEYKVQKEFIYDIYLKTDNISKKEGRDNIIKLVNNLQDNDRNIFIYEKLLKACQFKEEEFFSNHENYKIKTLCELKEELNKQSKDKKVKEFGIIELKEKENEFTKEIENVLGGVYEKLEFGKITKRDLERFLNIKKEKELNNESVPKSDKIDEYAKEKLGLISLILEDYVAEKRYFEYKNIIDKINKTVDELIKTKDSLMIFHRNTYIEEIRNISKILEKIEKSNISNFKNNETNKLVEVLKNKHKDLIIQIDKVRDFLLFQKIFEDTKGINQEDRFNKAYFKLEELKGKFKENPKNIEVIFNDKSFKNIFEKIKEELSRKDEIKSNEFVEQMINNFEVTDENAIKDLKMLIKSKKYEMIVKSIDYFFNYFLNKDLNLNKKMKKLSEEPLSNLKDELANLKNIDVYDYESNSPYYRVFTSIYEKKEAIDFLLNKIKEAKEEPKTKNLKNLKDKLQNNLDPTNRSITIKDIDDMIDCLKHINKLLNKDINNIIKYLKNLNEENIKKFERFSKKYVSIIALDNKSGGDSFKEVYDIIQDAKLLFHLDSEDLKYKINGEEKRIVNVDKLIKLGNKINIERQNKKTEVKEIKEEIKTEIKEEKEENVKKDIFELKCDKLRFFKDLVSKIEIIYDRINILRSKGYNIPIEIKIEIKYPIEYELYGKPKPYVAYELYGKPKDFNNINEYLFEIKNEYETQLSANYESEKYIRFLYGKLLRKVSQHQKGHCEIDDIIRYILNKTKVNKEQNTIQDTDEKHVPYIGEKYEVDYKDYMEDIFKGISYYLRDLFKVNKLDYQKHYKNMEIKEEKKSDLENGLEDDDHQYRKYKKKGISIIKCKEEQSMEENILSLFANRLDKLPIAQNVLICSRETTIEEIQSFLYRAIMCEFNTLFVLEILDSFSNFQHNKMYSYIDKLTSIKIEKYKNKNKDNKSKINKNIDKSNSSEYLDSYIVFIFKKLSNESAFKNEMNNYIKNDKEDGEELQPNYNDEENKMGDLDISNISFYTIRSIKNDDIDDLINNIIVISSEVCGLGKSFRIKQNIKEEGKIYYHFPLGGKLTKKIIYQKILDLFERIKAERIKDNRCVKKHENSEDKEDINEEYTEFDKVAIHLDIIETKDIDLVNEFLFSFLITKFYTNNENIIYIPNNIKIYIEVPNSTVNYLKKFGILKAFNRKNIICGDTLLKKPNGGSNVEDVVMLPLGLKPEIIEKFKRINEIETNPNEEIEKFIKDNFEKIHIKKYSFNQIQTFIKLYISQFDSFEGEYRNWFYKKRVKIPKECIDLFAQSTKYFINSGFANKIMNKNNVKDIFDLCEGAYNCNDSDISKEKFNTPLIYLNKETKTFELEKLPDIAKEKDKLISSKNVDIVYLIDATGSMEHEIFAAKENVTEIFKKLTESNKGYNFRFGAVFYRDKIDSPSDENEYFEFTDNMEDLKEKIGTVEAKGGRDEAEDWVGGYEIALNDMKWRENGIKLIIHIADAGAHGKKFTNEDKHYDQEELLPPKIEECVKRNMNIIGFKIGNSPKKSFDEISKIYNNFKKNNYRYDNGQFIDIYEFIRDNQDVVTKNFNKLVMKAAKNVINPSYKYLKRLKKILYLDNDVEEDKGDKKSLISILEIGTSNYVITEDNYKKMVLLVYRIKANLPVIIMGETGCGKTSLIKKLSQILNNGEELVEIINIHPGITNEEITKKMEEMNETAKSKKYKNKELWLFFDEINTCLSLDLLTEIFVNRTFNGKKLEDNIRLIGACNPYRKRKEDSEICGLIREYDEDDEDNKDDQTKKLVYMVEQLPESLLYYVFSFGSITVEDEKKYIESIIQKLFIKGEEKLHEITTEAISKCHIFLRKTFIDPSIVSLREIARFTSCVEFFQEYFPIKKNENRYSLDNEIKKLYKIKSIICSIYICYYTRLTSDEKRKDFEIFLHKTLLNLVNIENDKNEKSKSNFSLRNEKLKGDLEDKNFENFSDLLKIEEEYLIKQVVEPDMGLGENQSLKEILFLIFLGVVTKIPLIIIGKPGTGKSLSAQLIYNSMRGEYSKNTFFKNYPKIDQIYFQGSENTNPEDVEELFKRTEELSNVYKARKEKSICMILFDELGLAEQSKTKPLKVLHSNLEYDGKKDGTCFIGISNYSLDAAKVNRALSLSVTNLKLDQLKITAESIVKSISDDIYNNNLIFNILSRAYDRYKYWLNFIKELMALKQYYFINNKKIEGKNFSEIKGDDEFIKLLKKDRKIKTEFHGNRDFYSLIKGVAREVSKLSCKSDEKVIVPIINHFIERNFGGITYDIDIDFNLILDDIKGDMEKLKKILEEKLEKKSNENKNEYDDDGIKKEEKNEGSKNKIKVTSVYLFKKIYNEACSLEKQESYNIQKDDLVKYNLNECINNNINDNNSRYLLLEIRSNLNPLINQIIRVQNSDRNNNIDTLIGSPFSADNNSDYKAKKINEIQNCASQKYKLIILQDLDQILAYLYDLFNMNYKIIDDQKFVRICLENFSEQLTPVSETFKIIVLVDKKFVKKLDMAFLNRLEKMQISFQDLLDKNKEENKKLTKLIEDIEKEIKLKEEIEKKKDTFNYDLKSLLVNCNKQEIEGLVYYLYFKYVKENPDNINEGVIKEKVYTKVSNLLPQDIAVILPEKNPIKEKYFEKKKYYNFIQYKNDLDSNSPDLANYKISIIYTFSDICGNIKNFNDDNKIMIENISTEGNLKNKIDEIKNKNKNTNIDYPYILIQFDDNNSKKIQFTSDYIINYLDYDGYHYIFIIYIHRNMNSGSKKVQRIYSIPNIYENINQLFIDNLEGSEISLNDLLNKDVKDIMDSFNNLDKEFREALTNFFYDGLNSNLNQSSKRTDISTYLNERYPIKRKDIFIENIINYMMYDDTSFKNKIIEKAKEIIITDEDAVKDCKNLIEKVLGGCYMNKDKIDIVSILLDYIIENIFMKYLNKILDALEDNNFLTTLLELSGEKNCKLGKNKDDKNTQIIKNLETIFLKEIKVDNKKYEPKFLPNYRIPGFYNFYKKLSNDLSKDINAEFLDNENYLRKPKNISNINKVKRDFHDKEEELLKKVLNMIKQDKLYCDLVNEMNPDLILNDYIIFYLEKYLGIYSKPFIHIIKLLLYYRFSDDINIIKNNVEKPINIVIIKTIWLESYITYIKDIANLFDFVKTIINDMDGEYFYNMIYNSISDNSIKFIVNKKRVEYTKEINECFYRILAGICLSLSTNNIDEMRISLESYCDILKEVKKIIQKMDEHFGLYIDELYIIDELIKIIEYNPNTSKNIIKQIKDKLVENVKIMQKNLSKEKLKENFKGLNDLLQKIKNEQTKEKYYATLKYIYKKEIEKVNDKVYCLLILEEIIKQKEILKISNDIFRFLLIKFEDMKCFESTKDYLLKTKDNILKFLDEKLELDNSKKDYYIALSEIIIYFFERISLLYLKGFSKKGKSFIEEKENMGHIYVFKECNKFLSELNKDIINEGLNVNITKLFCIGYIKTFCFMFIEMHNKRKFKPDKIIEIINESDEINMVKIYIYKIIYNKNQKRINIFVNSDIIKKYKLKTYKGFKDFIKPEDIEKLEKLENLSYGENKSNDIFKILEENSKNQFEDKITEDKISKPRTNFDDFYIAAYQLILSKLNDEDFENDNSYTNFYENVCKPLYQNEDYDKDDNKLFSLMKIFFEKGTYLKFKKDYEINPEDIEALLYGYRYCLNEVKSLRNREEDYIYSYL